MSSSFIAIIGAAIVLVLVLILVGPYAFGMYRRTRMHGPIPTGGPGGSGAAWGWFLSAIWTFGETKREEQFHYLEGGITTKTGGDGFDVLEPAAPPEPIDTDRLLPRDEQELSGNRRQWWSGKEWVSVNDFVPPSSERSTDGEQWWDGEAWQWTPGTFEAPSSWMPQRMVVSRLGGRREKTSWVIEQRGHLADRWIQEPAPKPDRSDPPPDWLDPA
jgi:hypothetical protein